MNKEIEDATATAIEVWNNYCDESAPKAMKIIVTFLRTSWLRSEIEKIVLPTPPDVLIPNESPIEHALREGEYHALTSIITRYKEELLELEKGV